MGETAASARRWRRAGPQSFVYGAIAPRVLLVSSDRIRTEAPCVQIGVQSFCQPARRRAFETKEGGNADTCCKRLARPPAASSGRRGFSEGPGSVTSRCRDPRALATTSGQIPVASRMHQIKVSDPRPEWNHRGEVSLPRERHGQSGRAVASYRRCTMARSGSSRPVPRACACNALTLGHRSSALPRADHARCVRLLREPGPSSWSPRDVVRDYGERAARFRRRVFGEHSESRSNGGHGILTPRGRRQSTKAAWWVRADEPMLRGATQLAEAAGTPTRLARRRDARWLCVPCLGSPTLAGSRFRPPVWGTDPSSRSDPDLVVIDSYVLLLAHVHRGPGNLDLPTCREDGHARVGYARGLAGGGGRLSHPTSRSRGPVSATDQGRPAASTGRPVAQPASPASPPPAAP